MSKERFKLIAAVFLVLKRGNDILLLQRKNTGYGNGWYSLVAGHVEDGESTMTAMVREAKEESDIVLDPRDVSLAHTSHYTSDVDGYKALMCFFVAEKWGGEIKNMEPEKCSDLSWFPIDNLPENTIPYIRQALEHIHDGVTYSEFGWE